MDVKGRLSPKHPFFEHGEAMLFTAHRDGRCVGRCTAQVDRLHLKQHGDDVGFFGFFDTINDAEVARALLDAAAEWLRARGMKRMRGPFMLTVNDQVGCLVEGFDKEPVFMMPYHRPYQGGLIEQAGLVPRVDAYAWYYASGQVRHAEPARRAPATSLSLSGSYLIWKA